MAVDSIGAHNSSSWIALGGGAVLVVEVVPGAEVPDTAASSAALKLWLAMYFSPPALVWSMLGRAFFSGLPTIPSAGVSADTLSPIAACGCSVEGA